MKYIAALFFASLALTSTLKAEFNPNCESYSDVSYCDSSYECLPCDAMPCIDWACGWDLELRSAYFYPSSSLERRIYKDPRWDVELEVDKTFCTDWRLFASLSYFNKKGHSIGLGDKTRLQLYPLTFGIKYVYPIYCNLHAYAGIGVNYTWMDLHNDSDFVKSHVHRSRFGATGKLGLTYDFTDMFFADLFADYIFIPMHLNNVNNVGGFRFGLGLGVHL